MTKFNEVCGIIVSYNPDESNLEIIKNNCFTLYSTILFDNSISQSYWKKIDKIIKEIQDSCNEKRKITLVRLGQNIGLSKSYNKSFRLAESLGFSYALILDQDSVITRDAINTLIRDFDSLVELGTKVGAIGMHNVEDYYTPLSFLFNGKFRWKGFYYTNNILEKRNLINSGMLVPLKTFNLLDGYDESFFVDNSDLEFTLRIRKRNLRLFESHDAKVMVNYKEATNNFLIASISLRSPDREYSIKDLIRCLPLAYKISKVDMFLILLLVISKPIGILLFKDNKRERFAYILSGIKEGICMIMMDRLRKHF